MTLPQVKKATKLTKPAKRILIAAYGFEERSLGWSSFQGKGEILSEAIVFRYDPNKGPNKIEELKNRLRHLGIVFPQEIKFNVAAPEKLEQTLEKKFENINEYDEVVFDITGMTKFLILVNLCKLTHFKGILRIVYSEAKDYSPSKKEYIQYQKNSKAIAHFPSQGFNKILRAKCLSSIRMQGQPVAVIAFASFNEQLVRHMLGTISPYRLIFINGIPPRSDYKWREFATQEIHNRLIEDYRAGNELDHKTGLLKRTSSTLFYDETFQRIDEIYKQYGLYERIIVAATGSKMQTIGLFFSKIKYPDIHIEYPIPDSYFFRGMSKGTQQVHEVEISNFNRLIQELVGLPLEMDL